MRGSCQEPSYDSGSSSSIVSVAEQYMGVPYVWGGTSPSGFDCSGFTQYVFRQCGYSINRTADAQYSNGSYVSYDSLQAGDLVFFANTYSASGITHVGIYIGGGELHPCGKRRCKNTPVSARAIIPAAITAQDALPDWHKLFLIKANKNCVSGNPFTQFFA